MMDILVQIEENGFSTWVRESKSLLAYPSVLFLHTVGMGFVAGISALIDLRILGFAPGVPVSPMQRLQPYMWAGFWLNLVTGLVLFAIDATQKATNPVFWIKLAFIAIALVIAFMIRNQIFRNPLLDKRPIPTNGKVLAIVSMLCWIGAVTCGRLLAYIGGGIGAK